MVDRARASRLAHDAAGTLRIRNAASAFNLS
jgi:hypothetical protein